MQEERITEAYVNEAMDLARYKAEMGRLKERHLELDRAATDLSRRSKQRIDGKRMLAQLEGFCGQVTAGLDALTFEERKQLMRLLVEQVIVEHGVVRIETIIPFDVPPENRSSDT